MLYSHSHGFVKLLAGGKGDFDSGRHLVECVGSKMQQKKRKKEKEIRAVLKKKVGERIFMLSNRCRIKGFKGC